MRILLPVVLATAALTAIPGAPKPRPRVSFAKTVLAASLFKAAWAYRHDRPWLESQLEWLSAHDVDAIRALGVVGDPGAPDYWDGREIDWRWPDYDEVIAGVTDLAYDKYGLQVQWTIFADAQKNTPHEDDRAGLVRRFVEMSRGRERKILAFEVANEFWNNGFDGEDGVRQLGVYARELRRGTSIPVAASSHRDELCPLYAEGVVDFATIHFDRRAPEARWAPLSEPWRIARQAGHFAACSMPEEASNNEPIGPGASHSEPMMPLHVVMSAVNTYLSNIPVYVFHSGPGVRDDATDPDRLRPSRFDQLPEAGRIFGGLAAIKRYVPSDITSWRSVSPTESDFPFTVNGSAKVALGATRGARFIVSLSGLEGTVEVVARRAVEVRRLDPVTGALLEKRSLKTGEPLRLTSEAAVLEGNVQYR